MDKDYLSIFKRLNDDLEGKIARMREFYSTGDLIEFETMIRVNGWDRFDAYDFLDLRTRAYYFQSNGSCFTSGNPKIGDYMEYYAFHISLARVS